MRKIVIALLTAMLALMPFANAFADVEGSAMPTAEVTVEATAEAAADYEELARNGSFDASGSAHWNGEAWQEPYSAMITEYEGESVAYLAATSVENDVRFYQQIKTEPNTVYMISCRVKTNNVNGGNGANVSVVDTYVFSSPVLGTTDWQEITLVGRTGAEQTSMVVCARIGGYGATSTGEAYFDDFSVRKVEDAQGMTVESFDVFTSNQSNTAEEEEESSSAVYVYLIAAFVVIVIAALIIMQKINKKNTPSDDASKMHENERATVKNKSEKANVPLKPILDDPEDTRLHLKKQDWIACIGLTVVYAVVALFNLGTTSAPQNYYKADFGEKATFTFSESVDISELWMFTGIDEGTVLISGDDGQSVTYKIENGAMYRWKKIDNAVVLAGKTITLEVTAGTAWINEIAFFDANGDLVTPTASSGAEAMIDEQDTIPENPSYYNGMYFDELYHARTAYEHLNGMYPYEWTHPPLGKLIISIGIALFGMSTFGWRIAGTVMGIIMVPIMYCFGKRIFKKWQYAFITAGVFAFDFMHFAQTRIATIDVYGVFFIILMFYYMYQYYQMNFFTHGLKATLKPLGLAGLFFGLGIASKWIGFYAGGGLAIVLLASFIKRYKEAKKLRASKSKKERDLGNSYWSNVAQTCMWCCLFYIIIPFTIYFLAFLPYYKYYGCLDGDGGIITKIGKCFERFITEQDRMFSYHSDLDATHSYSSPWYQWPVIGRPVWYYIGYYPGTENASTISGMGNPAVWWTASAASIYMLVKMAVTAFKRWLSGKDGIMELGKVRESKSESGARVVLAIAIAANFLPWMLVSRCTFQYHFFATVPFIILLAKCVFKQIEDRNPKLWYIKWIWLALTVVLFILFYPVISGYPMPTKYIDSLQWLPGWSFRGY